MTIAEARREVAAQRAVLDAGTPQLDEYGKVIEEPCTCGECGMTWNDALITSWTPAPSARCPYEYQHEAIRLSRRKRATF